MLTRKQNYTMNMALEMVQQNDESFALAFWFLERVASKYKKVLEQGTVDSLQQYVKSGIYAQWDGKWVECWNRANNGAHR